MAQKALNTRSVLAGIKIVMSIVLSVMFYALVIVAISKMCTTTYSFMYQIFGNVTAQAVPGNDVEFTINEGEATLSVASKLEQSRLIVNKYSFYIRAQLTAAGDGGSPIIPGTYQLNTSMSYDEILSIITDYGADERKEDE